MVCSFQRIDSALWCNKFWFNTNKKKNKKKTKNEKLCERQWSNEEIHTHNYQLVTLNSCTFVCLLCLCGQIHFQGSTSWVFFFFQWAMAHTPSSQNWHLTDRGPSEIYREIRRKKEKGGDSQSKKTQIVKEKAENFYIINLLLFEKESLFFFSVKGFPSQIDNEVQCIYLDLLLLTHRRHTLCL